MNQKSEYRSIIKKEFEKRRLKEPSYSLRSYAHDLEVSASMLSEVLNFKKNLARKTAVKISAALKLSKNESKLFLMSVDLDSPSSIQSRDVILDQIANHTLRGKVLNIKNDEFEYISDYRHLVLLALLSVESFKNDLSWIANKIGIFQHEASSLLKRLIKLDIIRQKQDKIEINYNYVQTDVSTTATRTFHQATLKYTLNSIDTIPTHERDLYSSMFAIDQNDFESIQKDIRLFHDEMYKKYSQKKSANRVYSIQNQLIPYTSRNKA